MRTQAPTNAPFVLNEPKTKPTHPAWVEWFQRASDHIPTSEKGAASGVASLNAGSKVVQDPANAQTAAAASKIPLSGAGGTLDPGWYSTSGDTGSIATATPTTIFSALSAGRYDVAAWIASGGASDYTAFATVVSEGAAARIVSNNGAKLTVTISGTNVQVTQTAGTNKTVNWSYLKIG
jgi:hypothetical protein